MNRPKVGDTWWRFEDRTYSVADMWSGEHSSFAYSADLLKYVVVKTTPAGVWVSRVFLNSPQNERRLCLDGWRKKFACPTVEDAYTSYKARKERQIAIYLARAEVAKRHLEAGRALMLTHKNCAIHKL